MLSIESFDHDSGRTLVHAKYNYLKISKYQQLKNKAATTVLNRVVGRIVTRVYIRHTMLVRIMSGMFRTGH
jgi:hypothetical protein